jgi:hypothetical protein
MIIKGKPSLLPTAARRRRQLVNATVTVSTAPDPCPIEITRRVESQPAGAVPLSSILATGEVVQYVRCPASIAVGCQLENGATPGALTALLQSPQSVAP